jgi:hypothetical protein
MIKNTGYTQKNTQIKETPQASTQTKSSRQLPQENKTSVLENTFKGNWIAIFTSKGQAEAEKN